MSFGDAARRLAGQAGLLLGWRPDEFWRATPDELETALGTFAEAMNDGAAPLDRAQLARLKEMHPDGGADE
ncbi:MAG: phage tail assembly chaperone [Sphingobium sp.]|nr:phage tail assembly chaperone [Sphingobium sp.]